MYEPQQYATPAERHAIAPSLAAVELAADRSYDRGPVVWVPDAYGRMVPMPKPLAPPMPEPTTPRDLTPRPAIDPRAQILAAGGLFAAGAGWGAAQLLSALAGAGTALGLIVAALLLAKLPTPGRGSSTTQIHNEVHHHNRWWGRSTTHL